MGTMQRVWRPYKKFASYCNDGRPVINQAITISVAGENALIVYFSDKVDTQVAARIKTCSSAIRLALGLHLIDLIPSYGSILVIYDSLLTDHFAVSKAIHTVAGASSIQASALSASHDGKLITLPVYYSLESGPDLKSLAENAGLSIDQVIEIHQAIEYRVYAIGFAPGFAYLGEVDERIAAPRLATPRLKVPRGAVAIADRQTAVYPAESPGGWNLVGLCPTPMFDAKADPIMPVSTGDRVVFKAIGKQEFIDLGGTLDTLGDLK